MTEIEKHFQCSSLFDVHKKLLQNYEANCKKQNLTQHDEILLRKNHKFLWDNPDSELSWEEELAKKYYDKLFKEFCICDLSRYKENQVALRWRTKNEVISGKGQFICATKNCDVKEHLRTWEVNFCYLEDHQKKNALVKIKLCLDCSVKLNYRSKKREVKRLKAKSKNKLKENPALEGETSLIEEVNVTDKSSSSSSNVTELKEDNHPWTQKINVEVKTRDEEMDDYLNDLLF